MAKRKFIIPDLESVLETDGTVKSVEVTRLTPPGENYSSLVLKADFNVEKNGHIRTISTVAKRVPMNSFMLSRALKSQENEITFYKKIVPLLLNFAKEYGLYNEANFYPTFCGSRYSLDKSKTEADEETVLLLNNLILEGYDVVDRYIGFDLESSKTVVKKLAMFHAIPIAMKFKNPEAFKILADYLEGAKEEHHGPPPEAKKGPGPGGRVNHLWLALQDMPECAPYLSRLQPIMNRPMMGPPKIDIREPWATITHNDYWGNNILIKPNKGKDASVILLDHARPTYDSFATDLLFFLLTSVQNEYQAEHFDDLLRVYYDEFTRLLKHFEVPVSLSFEEYMDEVNLIAKKTEVGHAIGFSNIIFGTKNVTRDHLTGDGNIFDQMAEMSKHVNQYQKNKIVSIASLSAKRNWI